MVGLPEAKLNLAQAVILLASCPKSNSASAAIEAAIADLNSRKIDDVPPHLCDSHYSGAAKRGHGIGYKYPHAYGGYVKQQYLPTPLVDATYYNGIKRGKEEQLLRDWEERRKS